MIILKNSQHQTHYSAINQTKRDRFHYKNFKIVCIHPFELFISNILLEFFAAVYSQGEQFYHFRYIFLHLNLAHTDNTDNSFVSHLTTDEYFLAIFDKCSKMMDLPNFIKHKQFLAVWITSCDFVKPF